VEQSRGLFSFPTGKTVSFRRAFATQYIAIILIVLTFVIGTFARNKLATRPKVQEPPKVVVASPPMLPVVRTPSSQFVGVLRVNDIFEQGSDILRPDMLQGLILVLKSHDLNARIDVFVEDIQAKEAGLQLAVSRTISLQKFLKSEGIAPENFQIYANPKLGDGSQRVALYRSKV
jgi:hypothetical protein